MAGDDHEYLSTNSTVVVIARSAVVRAVSWLQILHSKIPITYEYRSPALSVIFLLSLHTVRDCFFIFLYLFSSLRNVVRSSDRKGV